MILTILDYITAALGAGVILAGVSEAVKKPFNLGNTLIMVFLAYAATRLVFQ